MIAVLAAHQIACRADRFFAERRAIGTHVSDVTVFVQLLCCTHRSLGGEAQLAVGFLLQRAGREGSAGAFGERFDFDRSDFEVRRAKSGGQLARLAARPSAASSGFFNLPVVESKSLPLGILRPSTVAQRCWQ